MANAYFLDKNDSIYKDIISDHDSLSSTLFTPHFGYPNLLPLAFGMIDPDSNELKAILNKI